MESNIVNKRGLQRAFQASPFSSFYCCLLKYLNILNYTQNKKVKAINFTAP